MSRLGSSPFCGEEPSLVLCTKAEEEAGPGKGSRVSDTPAALSAQPSLQPSLPQWGIMGIKVIRRDADSKAATSRSATIAQASSLSTMHLL